MHQRIQLECGINASDVVLWKIQHRITIIIIFPTIRKHITAWNKYGTTKQRLQANGSLLLRFTAVYIRKKINNASVNSTSTSPFWATFWAFWQVKSSNWHHMIPFTQSLLTILHTTDKVTKKIVLTHY